MLDLSTAVWERSGPFEGMDELFRDVGLPSLMQPDNIPAASQLIGSYNFYATEQARGTIKQSKAYQELERTVPILWYPLQKGIGHYISNIVYQMSLSAEGGNHLLVIAADHVVGNRSILNMAQLCAEGKYKLIVYGPPKVNPTAFDEIKTRFQAGEVISNRKLVSIFMAHGCGCPGTITPSGPNRWLVVFRLPSPCIQPDKALIEFFSTNDNPHAGFDHGLPIWMVENKYPWHYIGHSDTFFVADRATPWRGGSTSWGLDFLSRADQFFERFTTEKPIVWEGGD